MPGPLVHVLASGNCPHGGKIALQTTNTRVFVNGMAVITATDLKDSGTDTRVPGAEYRQNPVVNGETAAQGIPPQPAAPPPARKSCPPSPAT